MSSDDSPRCSLATANTQTKDWYAWLDLMPPTPDELHVTGEVYVSNPGVDTLLVPKQPQGINPEILLLELLLCQRSGIWAQFFVWKPARYDKVAPPHKYKEVHILGDGGAVIAKLPVNEVH